MAIPAPMRRLPRWATIVVASLGGLAVVLLLLWQVLPGVLQSRTERFVFDKTGHRLVMARPHFNPLTLDLRLADLKLLDPAGQTLLAFDRLEVDLALLSLVQRALIFDAIRLEGPKVSVIELPGGTLNWGPFLQALQTQEDAPTKTVLPRFYIRKLDLEKGRLDFADRRTASGFATRIEPLDLALTDLSTLPDDSGQFRVSARSSSGAEITLAGTAALEPLQIAGTVNLKGLPLAQFAPFLRGLLPGLPHGTAAVIAHYQLGMHHGKFAAQADRIEAKIEQLTWHLETGNSGPLLLGNLVLAGGRVDLTNRQVAIDSLTLTGGAVPLRRDAAGHIAVIDALTARASPPSAPAAAGKPWRFRLDTLALTHYALQLRDDGVVPAAELELTDIAVSVTGLSEDLGAALPVKAAFAVRSGGSFTAAGTLIPAPAAADISLKLADLTLKPLEPYLAQRAHLAIASGTVSTQGRVRIDAQGPSYRGDFLVRELRLDEAQTSNPMLAWKSLGTGELRVTPQELAIGELRLNGLDTQLVIAPDRTLGLQKLLKPVPDSVAAAAPEAAAPGWVVNIDRLRFYNSEMDFADHSLLMPFGTRIHKLRGSVNHMSSQPGRGPGQLELEGDVDDYGMARALGQVDLFDPTGFMDIRVQFRNVEMTRLTPYMATFAGRKIDSGKLTLDLRYQLKQRQLQGDNQIVIDRLALGERVESPTARDLPLDLAIALLQDADGRIDLGLPISGSLDDPEFSYGDIVWRAIGNVLKKIVTAPFRALAALFGGDEKLEAVVFEAGAGQLTPPEREKLLRIAAGLEKRPGLVLGVIGLHTPADRLALQDVQLRRTLAARMGLRVSDNWDPGALSTRQPAVRDALEKLYGERSGASELAALKDGFRQANPGQLEESVGGRVMSRLSGLWREKKTLSETEVSRLAGADFHAILYEKLRDSERIDEARLVTLGQARADFAAGTLKAAGLPAERLKTLPPEAGEAAEAGVPLKLELDTRKPD